MPYPWRCLVSFNGSGLFVIDSTGQPVSANTLIESSVFNALTADLATGLSNCITKDGQQTVTANLPMATYRHTGVGNASARTDYAAAGQVQDGKLNWVDGGGTADAITATYSPAITALVDGQLCCVRATAANATTTPTFAPNGLTARTIVKKGGAALVAGDIVADGHELILRYDLTNTRWELMNPGSYAGTGANTFTGIQRWAKGADVASANALTLGTDGNYFDITGTTAITSIGTLGVGTVVKLHFDAALTLTHHATDLILPGATNITTAAGTEIELVEYATGDWRMVGGVKADGTAWVTSGNVKLAGDTVQVVEATPYTTAGSTATAIPLDSTIPQNTEGAELTTVTITPTNASNRLRIEALLPFVDGSAGVFLTAALFQDSIANALAISCTTLNAANYSENLSVDYEMAAGTTSATTFKLRAGPSAGGTMYFNRRAAGETMGGVSAVRLRVTEIQV